VAGLDPVLGQPEAVALLRRMLANERVPQALLFQGPEGVGKATTARAFAACLLCEQGRGCGACRACRLAASGGHPDLLTVTLEPRESRGPGELASVIVIAQIRELARLAGLAPREGRRRVFLVDPADRMNAESQNALLKTLEEPPGATVVLLVAARPHLLLPTVRSRCFAVRFTPLADAELARLLVEQGLDEADSRSRAALAGGRAGRALALVPDAVRERRERLLAMLEAAAAGEVAELPAWAAELAGGDESALLDDLEILQGLLRDAARSAGNAADRIVPAELGPRVAGLGRRLGARRAAELVSGVDRVRGFLRFNANRVLIAESILAAVAGGPLPARGA
jgi:DNA polymerase-3 subunit delta'